MAPPPPPPSTPQANTNPNPTTEAHAAFTASLKSVASNHDAELQERARNLHANAAALSKQESSLQKATADLARQNEGWTAVAEEARVGLKEIGDVQNWAEIIERELLVLGETVRLVEERDLELDLDSGPEGEGGAGDVDGGGGGRGERDVGNGVVAGGDAKMKKRDDNDEVGQGSGKGWLRWW